MGPKPLSSDDSRFSERVVTPVSRVGVLVADDDVVQEVNPDNLRSLPECSRDRHVGGGRYGVTGRVVVGDHDYGLFSCVRLPCILR